MHLRFLATVNPSILAYAWRDEKMPKLEVIAFSVSVLMLVVVAVLNMGPVKEKSDKWLLAQRTSEIATYYWRENRFSSRFYSQGKAELLNKEDELNSLVGSPFYVVLSHDSLNDLQAFSQCTIRAETAVKSLLLCGK